MMVNNNLVGGWPTPLKNDGVNGKDVPYIMENKSHVPNHQPDMMFIAKFDFLSLGEWWILWSKTEGHQLVALAVHPSLWVCLPEF